MKKQLKAALLMAMVLSFVYAASSRADEPRESHIARAACADLGRSLAAPEAQSPFTPYYAKGYNDAYDDVIYGQIRLIPIQLEIKGNALEALAKHAECGSDAGARDAFIKAYSDAALNEYTAGQALGYSEADE